MSHAFNWTAAYPSQRSPVFARNIVSTSHPLAAQAGLRMLHAGGNAVDAAIATAAVMTIVEPCSNGLGSDAFAIVWDGKGLHGLNASGCAPQAWTPDYFKRKYGADVRTPPKRGWDSVTVPGAVAGWVALSTRFGKLPFADLLAPAIEVAERGYAVPVIVQQKWHNAASLAEITSQAGFAAAFLPQGRAPNVGERFAFAEAARTLKLIAESRGDAFYRGAVAAALAAHAAANGGAMTAADLAAYAPEWVTPISRNYRDHTLHEIPPNGQGIAALIALGILDKFDLAALPVDGVASQHLQIEAMKLAFADVYKYVAEPKTMRLSPAEMLDDAYLQSRARLIDPKRAQDFGPGHAPKGGTIYLTAADASGMMVSFIQSNYMGFGSGIVVPGYGVSLQNRGHGFTLDPTSDNLVGPGKRPFHTIIPAFLTKQGQPVMSFGVMGGDMQPQGHLQTLVRMLDYKQQPQAACDAPRWRWNSGLVNAEQGFAPATAQGLRDLGHRVEPFADSYQDYGAGQFIWRLGDPAIEGYAAASDPRRDGRQRAIDAGVTAPVPARAPPWTGLALAAAGSIAFSGKAIIVKLAYRHGVDAVTLIMYRMLFALPLFVGLAWWAGRGRPALTARDLRVIGGLGFCGYYLASFLDFAGLAYISASLERLILYLNPTLVLALSVLLGGQRARPRQLLALAVSYAGVLLVFGHEVRLIGPDTALGAGLVFASAVSYAIYLVYSGKEVQRLGALRLTGWASTVACLFCLAQFALLRPLAAAEVAAPVIWLSLLNATLCTFVPVILVMMAIERVGPTVTAQTGMIGPLSTIAMGVLILGEPLNAWIGVGTVLVLSGVWLLARAR